MDLFIKFLATYLLIIIFLLAVYALRRSLREYLSWALAGYGLAQVINTIIKGVYYVQRPYLALGKSPLVVFPPKDSSFPSGHAISVFLLAMLVYYYNKRLGIIFFILATLVGIGRVLALVHYPLDIIAGAVIGITSVIIVKKIGKSGQ